VEATAIGNVLVQAIAAGDLSSISDARRLIAASFELERYEPRDAPQWGEAYSRFVALVKQ
jgi:rhamnulokinase